MTPLILCTGVDFTAASRIALAQSVRLLEGRGGELHVVTVVAEQPRSAQDIAALERAMEFDMAKLSTLVDNELGEQPSIHIRLHIRVGKPAAVINQLACDYDADMIVVGTHGRSGVEKWVLGSVAEELVRIARCPVFVARTRNFGDMTKTPRLGAMPVDSSELHRSQVRGSVHPVNRSSHVSGML
jgi:nucleotide-binding universal stress UspA family protein